MQQVLQAKRKRYCSTHLVYLVLWCHGDSSCDSSLLEVVHKNGLTHILGLKVFISLFWSFFLCSSVCFVLHRVRLCFVLQLEKNKIHSFLFNKFWTSSTFLKIPENLQSSAVFSCCYYTRFPEYLWWQANFKWVPSFFTPFQHIFTSSIEIQQI